MSLMRYCFLILILLINLQPAWAKDMPDTDNDAVPDKDELEIYHTDINNPDTDGDGYSDWLELVNGYSPLDAAKIKLEDSDYDNDGLSDRMELNFHTDIASPDSDNDGYSDGAEINNGYDPLNSDKIKLDKRIEINTGAQELSYFLGGVRMDIFPVSTGKPSMPTPKGHYNIDNKSLRAWSARWGLWMPWWLGMQHGYFGIHELPEWPNGFKEGEDHLGKPVSHGCIRLGIGPAEFLYNWADIGTPAFIY